MQNQAKATEVIQVGIFVKDVNETAKKLEELLGIGPFEIFEPDYKDLTYRGKPGKFGVKIGLAKAGPDRADHTCPRRNYLQQTKTLRNPSRRHSNRQYEEERRDEEKRFQSDTERKTSRNKMGLPRY
ncbi:MAG: hypothetical protein ABSD49_12530 [Candidatus Bathyarchaeia archaeon]